MRHWDPMLWGWLVGLVILVAVYLVLLRIGKSWDRED